MKLYVRSSTENVTELDRYLNAKDGLDADIDAEVKRNGIQDDVYFYWARYNRRSKYLRNGDISVIAGAFRVDGNPTYEQEDAMNYLLAACASKICALFDFMCVEQKLRRYGGDDRGEAHRAYYMYFKFKPLS